MRTAFAAFAAGFSAALADAQALLSWCWRQARWIAGIPASAMEFAALMGRPWHPLFILYGTVGLFLGGIRLRARWSRRAAKARDAA